MLALRTALAIAMILVGAALLIRMISAGVYGVTGFVLGVAILALGVYRLAQIRRARTLR